MAKKKRNQFDVDEIYRSLRTNIEFSQMDDDIQVISIASTIPNEGKSSVACNLARIMAAKYKNVLLIDCDLRNASVHKMMKISNRSGLTNIIAQFQDGLSLHSYEGVQEIQFEGGQTLTVITSGHKVPNPSEVLGSKRMGRFLEQARKEFGYIIIDSPPVLVTSDSIPLCNLSDGVLYVVDAKNADKRKVKAAINDLKRNGGHVIGVVLNKVDMNDEKRYGYGYGYGYGGETTMAKRNSLIFLTAFGLLLTGCSKSGLEITKDDILEVARDDANATKKECENVSIKEQKSSYIVSFTTNGGSYEYKIGKDGIIKERNYKRGAKEESAETEKVEEPVKEEKSTTTKKKESSSTSFDESSQQAINAVLANSGLEQDDVTNITCSLDEASQQYTITFVLNDVTTTATVDANSFTVLSTIVG